MPAVVLVLVRRWICKSSERTRACVCTSVYKASTLISCSYWNPCFTSRTPTYIPADAYRQEPTAVLSLFLKNRRGNTLCSWTEMHSFLKKNIIKKLPICTHAHTHTHNTHTHRASLPGQSSVRCPNFLGDLPKVGL